MIESASFISLPVKVAITHLENQGKLASGEAASAVCAAVGQHRHIGVKLTEVERCYTKIDHEKECREK